ncbi:MAG: metal ABC transporter solute-binding protein, Zn/Mn family, partial [Thermoanaerobaculia bacterium]
MALGRYAAPLVLLLASGCGGGSEGAAASPTPSAGTPATVFRGALPIRAVATTGMVADLVAGVGGPRVAVSGLMGEGVDPHLYHASPGDLQKLAAADIIFYNGLHLEGKMAEVFARLSHSRATFAVTEGLPPELLRQPPEFQGQFDPHVWFDVSLWARCALRLGEILAAFDPGGAAEYRERAAKLQSSLLDLHQEVRMRIAEVPREARVLVTAHDAFGYFGRAYDLEVRGIQGLSTDSEASVREIGRLVALIAERKVRAVFVETSVSERNIRALIEGCAARGHRVVVGGQLFSDAMGKPGTPEGTYAGMVRHNVET